jgi:hypothetical protein
LRDAPAASASEGAKLGRKTFAALADVVENDFDIDITNVTACHSQ